MTFFKDPLENEVAAKPDWVGAAKPGFGLVNRGFYAPEEANGNHSSIAGLETPICRVVSASSQ
jgi:hypothetical protein